MGFFVDEFEAAFCLLGALFCLGHHLGDHLSSFAVVVSISPVSSGWLVFSAGLPVFAVPVTILCCLTDFRIDPTPIV